MMIIEITKKRIIGTICTLIIWVVSVAMEDKVKEIFKHFKHKIMSSYFMILTISLVIVLGGLFIYWFLKDIKGNIDNLDKRVKMISAILIENTNLGRINMPTRESLIKAGVTINDLIYFGYTKEQIQNVFPEFN